MMDVIEDAQYRVVHEFPGGAVRLGPLVNLNPGTLSNKVHPGMNHQLTLREAVVIQHATRDYRILQAEAQVLHHACIPLGQFHGISDMELLNAYAAWHEDIGQTMAAIKCALADGSITRDEIRRIRKELQDDVQRGLEFINRLEAVCDE